MRVHTFGESRTSGESLIPRASGLRRFSPQNTTPLNITRPKNSGEERQKRPGHVSDSSRSGGFDEASLFLKERMRRVISHTRERTESRRARNPRLTREFVLITLEIFRACCIVDVEASRMKNFAERLIAS